ncbi:Hin recombinase [Listeria monocytogenes]|nr:Hin recombinase [Listeria monocytogenes]EAH3791827.1 Hin recombinase [Listeria monocytogenes]
MGTFALFGTIRSWTRRARARGRFGGRPEKLTSEDMALIKNLLAVGALIKAIAARWNVSRTTIYRYLRKDTSI